MANAHPIALEVVIFTRCAVFTVGDHVPGLTKGLLIGPENNLNVSKSPDTPGRYVATMKTIFNPTNDVSAPYNIDVECVATFKVDDSLTDEEAARGTLITANSVLYGAIRETVAWLTARQAHGPLILGLSVLQPSALATTKS